MTTVISVGGSIIAPDEVDTKFIGDFVAMINEWLLGDEARKIIIVTGGGAPARHYQAAYRIICDKTSDDNNADWIGIMATRLNAQLLKACFGAMCKMDVVTNPMDESTKDFFGRVLIAAGWKPGFSTDNDAALLAKRYGASTIINLSNIEKVYTADPKKDPHATPIDKITWDDFCNMVGDVWTPGGNYPFDPVASKLARDCKMKVICAGGRNIQNTKNILSGSSFIGTTIE